MSLKQGHRVRLHITKKDFIPHTRCTCTHTHTYHTHTTYTRQIHTHTTHTHPHTPHTHHTHKVIVKMEAEMESCSHNPKNARSCCSLVEQRPEPAPWLEGAANCALLVVLVSMPNGHFWGGTCSASLPTPASVSMETKQDIPGQQQSLC